ncbi:hypothetical protein AAHA92_15601 [Salvia divinorum]|uniref:DDE Tnp4 domain-containing protein n=1 Tax=Salvia divinorum TaxID=28513 RepID=A0ABD1HHU1_SALDI
MRHTKARNVIERAFAVLKMRWGILRSASFYPIKVLIHLILACFLLHNFIRGEMVVDPIEQQLDDEVDGDFPAEEQADTDFVNTIEATNAWQLQRDELALAMWNHISSYVSNLGLLLV